MRTSLCLALLTLVAAPACGSPSSTPRTDSGTPVQPTITISAFSFSPSNLVVAPGATVKVINTDSAPHSVTSEADAGTYVLGAVGGVQFDTGQFTGSATFTVPASAAVGTVIPYFCTVHTSMMANSGKVTVGTASAAGGTPDPVGGGPTRY